MGGGNSFYNVIRSSSYKIYNDVILTGTLNGNISSSSFNWNRSDNLLVNLQNNLYAACFILTGLTISHVPKDWAASSSILPHCPRLIIEYKE